MNTGSDAERAAVEALLRASMFQRAPNLRKLIAFLWEQYSQGNTAQIKEYTIATEVLGRPPSFDQKRDSIVRVEMHRLRRRLREYYEGPGAGSEIAMNIPEGNYIPVFERRAVSGTAPAESPARQPDPEEFDELEFPIWGEEEIPPTGGKPASRALKRTWWTAAAVAGIGVVLVGVLIGAMMSRNSGAKSPSGVVRAAEAPDRNPATAGKGIRLLAGREKGEPMTDHLGQVWLTDRYFAGGAARTGPHARIAGSPEQFLFDTRREGDFQYSIPLEPGYYELRLYFAETLYGEGNVAGLGETSRLFFVDANNRPILEMFDLLADAEGPNVACVKVFKDIQPANDGKLHLNFRSTTNGRPILNALEIRPSEKGRILPLRMVAQEEAVEDSRGQMWAPDHWVTGGIRIRRPAPPAGTPDQILYLGERYGHFTYRIPVAPGAYQLTLYWTEAWFGPSGEGGGGAGSRIFSVYCNHRPLVESFDLFSTAGGPGIAYRRTFTGLKPNAQGKLVIQFQPEVNYSLVNALSIEDVSPR